MSNPRARHRQRKKSREWATRWAPRPGAILTGTFERLDEGSTPYGLCDVAQLRDEDGFLWAIWLSRTVLEAEWRKAAPKVGDRVTICYEGMKQGGGHPYHDYSLSAEHAPAQQSDLPC